LIKGTPTTGTVQSMIIAFFFHGCLTVTFVCPISSESYTRPNFAFEPKNVSKNSLTDRSAMIWVMSDHPAFLVNFFEKLEFA